MNPMRYPIFNITAYVWVLPDTFSLQWDMFNIGYAEELPHEGITYQSNDSIMPMYISAEAEDKSIIIVQ